MRRDVVVLMIQYDRDCDDEVLGIQEQVALTGEGVVAVKAVFGADKGTVGQGLGSTPVRHRPKRVLRKVCQIPGCGCSGYEHL